MKKEELEEIKRCVEVLNNGGTLLYPTDTIWGLGCDATNINAINKIFEIKGRDKNKSMLLLCKDFNQLAKYVEKIPSVAKEMIEASNKPTSIIYPKACNLPKEIIAEDGSIGIRIPKNEFCLQLLEELGRPIVSTSANISGEEAPLLFSDISKNIKEKVGYVVNMYQNTPPQHKASKIIRITEMEQIEVLRDLD